MQSNSIEISPGQRQALEARFHAKVRITETCWFWIGAISALGYGRFNIGYRIVNAHRAAYALFVAPLAAGLDIDHLCRVHACVNPSHLEAVPRRVNVLRGVGYTAQQARKTHCKWGHPFDAANTYVGPNGGRWCRTCQRAAGEAWRQKDSHKAYMKAYSREWGRRRPKRDRHKHIPSPATGPTS